MAPICSDLDGLLTDGKRESPASSVLNAYYASLPIFRAIYNAVVPSLDSFAREIADHWQCELLLRESSSQPTAYRRLAGTSDAPTCFCSSTEYAPISLMVRSVIHIV